MTSLENKTLLSSHTRIADGYCQAYGRCLSKRSFAKVKRLTSDMLARLEESAAADATEESYRDKEWSESNAKKDDQNAEIMKLSTSIDLMTSNLRI